MMDAVRQNSPEVKWICDTHDVQFVRSETALSNASRLWVGPADEREAELAALARYDAILAISQSDGAQLSKHLPRTRVVSAPPGFDYAYLPVPADPARPPFRYGFLGWKMSANVSALQLLVREWWPEILRVSPGSRLCVAGTVCARSATKRLARDRPEIDLHGYVPSLSSFYQGVDVVLNPVVVQGGLNVKSVEALVAGRLLITNPLGARCLGEGAPVVVADSAESIAGHLETFSTDPAEMHRRRGAGQEWAIQEFGEESTYRGLRELLRRR